MKLSIACEMIGATQWQFVPTECVKATLLLIAIRHRRMSFAHDSWLSSKAERQTSNFLSIGLQISSSAKVLSWVDQMEKRKCRQGQGKPAQLHARAF